ncbi:hypothetical protein LAHI110946_09395 [Lactococcus hircilactis]
MNKNNEDIITINGETYMLDHHTMKLTRVQH